MWHLATNKALIHRHLPRELNTVISQIPEAEIDSTIRARTFVQKIHNNSILNHNHRDTTLELIKQEELRTHQATFKEKKFTAAGLNLGLPLIDSNLVRSANIWLQDSNKAKIGIPHGRRHKWT